MAVVGFEERCRTSFYNVGRKVPFSFTYECGETYGGA